MSKPKVLIIDDEKDSLHLMATGLRGHGYNVVVAADGLLGIDIARKEKPDIILLDILLPAGSGFLVMKRLAQIAPLCMIPIIVITGVGGAESEKRAEEAGATGYLEKPFKMGELVAMIQEILEEAGVDTEE